MDKGYVHLDITFIRLGAIGSGALNGFTIETQIGAVWRINY